MESAESELSIRTSGAIEKAEAWRGLTGARADRFGNDDLAAQRLVEVMGDASAAPHLVLVEVEGARAQDRVEREPVRRREDMRVDDIRAAGRAGAGDGRQQPSMVLRDDGQFDRAARLVEGDGDDERRTILGKLLQQFGVAQFVGEVHLQPIGLDNGDWRRL